MQLKRTAYLMVGMFLLPVNACVAQSNRPIISVSSPPSEVSTPVAQRPETITTTLSVEGEPTEVELQLVDEASLPFTTYIPEGEFVEEVASSGDGSGVRFYFSPTGTPNENAYLQIFFPTNAPDTATLRTELLGDQGLLAANGWEVIDRTPTTAYPWAEEQIVYEKTTSEGAFTGTILIGKHQGKSFLAFTYYPVEYGDGFEPRASIILENIEFRD